MSSAEALTVTGLGLAVVFTGLVLCVLFILLLKRVAARVRWDGPHGHAAPRAIEQPTAPPAPVPPEVLAVIVAVLEVERALYVGRYRSRLTLKRQSPPAGDIP